MDEVSVRSSTEVSADEDHYAVLTQMLTTASQDQAQLRLLVYEFARRKLRRSLYTQFEDGDWSGIQEQMRALESAIERIEADSAKEALTFPAEPPLTQRELLHNSAAKVPNAVTQADHGAPSIAPQQLYPIRQSSRQPSYGGADYVAIPTKKLRRARLWWQVQLSAAMVLGVIIYATFDGRAALGYLRSHGLEALINTRMADAGNAAVPVSADRNPDAKKPPPRPKAPSIPLPTEYGAYVLSKGQLTELTALAMRIPDHRVAISPVIPTPSRTHLPAGKLEFVVFRRDLANNAPDRISVRVVAKVVRALTFDPKGKATTTNVADSWVVRSNDYPLRVGPIADNPEMLLIRPDPPDLIFPAGRYVLVLKGVGYDFTLDGPTADAAHCLERTDALMVPIYTECRTL